MQSKASVEAGPIPCTNEYWPYRKKWLAERLQDPALLDRFRRGDDLPAGYGYGIDERCVEYPWFFGRLAPGAGKLLDAGSTLNHKLVLDRPTLEGKTIHIVTLAPEPNCFWRRGISYFFHDLRDLPVRDDYYDEIACLSTLEHVGFDNTYYTQNEADRDNRPQDYLEAVGELRRVLRPGGSLFVTVPFGRYRRFGNFQQFDALLLDRAIDAFGKTARKDVTFYRYTSAGWKRSNAGECKDCEYVEWTTWPRERWPDPMPVEPDRAYAARAVACVLLQKG